jgi:hypothetical protein
MFGRLSATVTDCDPQTTIKLTVKTAVNRRIVNKFIGLFPYVRLCLTESFTIGNHNELIDITSSGRA